MTSCTFHEFKIMWGFYDSHGYWQPNPKLKISADEQWRQNRETNPDWIGCCKPTDLFRGITYV